MARTTTITIEQVAAAAESIKEAGEKPTARRVRDALGTGSMATILKFFQAWQGKTPANDGGLEIEVDPGIVKAIAVSIAAQVAAAGVEAQEKMAELQKEVAALVQENERQAALIDDLSAELEGIRLANSNLKGKIEINEKLIVNGNNEINEERQKRSVAEQLNATLEERINSITERYELLLQSQEKAEALNRDLMDELRKTSSKKIEAANPEKQATSTSKKPRPSRAKPKAPPSPATN